MFHLQIRSHYAACANIKYGIISNTINFSQALIITHSRLSFAFKFGICWNTNVHTPSHLTSHFVSYKYAV